MNIAGIYSFNRGKEIVEARYVGELAEVKHAIDAVDSFTHQTKVSKEKTKPGKMLYLPRSLNIAFNQEFKKLNWQKHRVLCEYSKEFYAPGFIPSSRTRGAFREMDFVKNHVGVEIQFGKYSFMVYNVAAKMTIFHNMGLIDVGIEIVPVRDFVQEMSSGVSYFEQFIWDLEHRGVSNIDIPVLILGITI